eukprot:EG_transcript_3565
MMMVNSNGVVYGGESYQVPPGKLLFHAPPAFPAAAQPTPAAVQPSPAATPSPPSLTKSIAKLKATPKNIAGSQMAEGAESPRSARRREVEANIQAARARQQREARDSVVRTRPETPRGPPPMESAAPKEEDAPIPQQTAEQPDKCRQSRLEQFSETLAKPQLPPSEAPEKTSTSVVVPTPTLKQTGPSRFQRRSRSADERICSPYLQTAPTRAALASWLSCQSVPPPPSGQDAATSSRGRTGSVSSSREWEMDVPPMYIRSHNAPHNSECDWPACSDNEWQPELQLKDLNAGLAGALDTSNCVPLFLRDASTRALPPDVWGLVFSFLPLAELLPSGTFFYWSRAQAEVRKCGAASLPLSHAHSLHVVCRFFQQRVLKEMLRNLTASPQHLTGLQPELQTLLNQMTVLPQFQNLHLQLITVGYLAFRTLVRLAPNMQDALPKPYCRNNVVFKMALGRLNTMRTFRIRDIAYVLPQHLHGNLVAQKLMLKALMASEKGDMAKCLRTGCTGVHSPGAESGATRPKKWDDLDFIVRTEREQVDDAFKMAVIEVVFHARYSTLRLDDSLGPQALQVLGQQLLLYCQTRQKPLRPLLITLRHNSCPAHAFLIEVLAHIIQTRLYTYLMVHATTVSLAPVLAVLCERREKPCWGTCRLNQKQFSSAGDPLPPLEEAAASAVRLDVLNLALKFVPKSFVQGRPAAKPRSPQEPTEPQ